MFHTSDLVTVLVPIRDEFELNEHTKDALQVALAELMRQLLPTVDTAGVTIEELGEHPVYDTAGETEVFRGPILRLNVEATTLTKEDFDAIVQAAHTGGRNDWDAWVERRKAIATAHWAAQRAAKEA